MEGVKEHFSPPSASYAPTMSTSIPPPPHPTGFSHSPITAPLTPFSHVSLGTNPPSVPLSLSFTSVPKSPAYACSGKKVYSESHAS